MEDQWLLDGNCDLCRRNKYCSKPCTANKRQREWNLKSLVIHKMINKVFKGDDANEKIQNARVSKEAD